MEQRLKKAETKQQQMMSFLARAMQNPNFVQQLVQQKDIRKELEEAISKKRRRPIQQGPSNAEVGEFCNGGGAGTNVKIEPGEFGELSEFEVSELDKLAMNMQGLSGSQQNFWEEYTDRGKEHGHGNKGKDFDDSFWENLLNEDTGEEMGILGGEGEDEEDLDVLANHLGSLGSSPK